MKINLSKKKKIIIAVILFVVLGGTGGYLLWRVNQNTNLGSENSNASNCTAVGTDTCDKYTGSCDEARGLKGCGSGLGDPGTGNSWCQHYKMVCTSVCGDGTCSSDETVAACPQDCAKCGDNICSSTESLTSCPADCSVCGDGKCTGSETLASCPKDCSVCGDGVCSGSETASTCASDCVCKSLTWGNKPSGTYTPTTVPNPITITNPNSSSTDTSGIIIKLNSTTISSCSKTSGNLTSTSVGGTCYTVSTTSGKETLSINILGDTSATPKMDVGTYTLSVTLPGGASSCKETTSFVVAEKAVPQTGVFDGTMGKIYLGTGFVFLGVITTQFSKFGYILNTLGERNRVVSEERRRKREEEKRNRFERRFK